MRQNTNNNIQTKARRKIQRAHNISKTHFIKTRVNIKNRSFSFFSCSDKYGFTDAPPVTAAAELLVPLLLPPPPPLPEEDDLDDDPELFDETGALL